MYSFDSESLLSILLNESQCSLQTLSDLHELRVDECRSRDTDGDLTDKIRGTRVKVSVTLTLPLYKVSLTTCWMLLINIEGVHRNHKNCKNDEDIKLWIILKVIIKSRMERQL